MTTRLSRRQTLAFFAGAAAPGLASLSGFGNSAAAEPVLPPARISMVENMPVPPPPFHFETAKGEKRTLADYRGHGLVVNFWATWCPPCRLELPTLAALAGAVKSDGILVLPISMDRGGAKTVDAYFAEHLVSNLPVLVDPSMSALKAFNLNGIPATMLVHPKGDVVAHLDGAADWDTKGTIAKLGKMIGNQAGTGASNT